MSSQKGIWIRKERSLLYETFLREVKDNVIGFIPFEHPYEPRYLGSIGFLDLADKRYDFSKWNLTDGLLQNHFYPIGGTAPDIHPLLVGKDLPRRIEIEIARDLLKTFSPETHIAIASSSESHLAYCARLGIPSMKQMALAEWLKKLEEGKK